LSTTISADKGPERAIVQVGAKRGTGLAACGFMTRTTLFCPACQSEYDPADGHYACPKAGDGREHILDARIEASAELAEEFTESWREHPQDPLRAFACLGAAQGVAGRPAFREAAGRLQEGLDRLEGAPLGVTPLVQTPKLAKVLGMAGTLAV